MQSQICNEAAHAERFLKNNFANLILLDAFRTVHGVGYIYDVKVPE